MSSLFAVLASTAFGRFLQFAKGLYLAESFNLSPHHQAAVDAEAKVSKASRSIQNLGGNLSITCSVDNLRIGLPR